MSSSDAFTLRIDDGCTATMALLPPGTVERATRILLNIAEMAAAVQIGPPGLDESPLVIRVDSWSLFFRLDYATQAVDVVGVERAPARV